MKTRTKNRLIPAGEKSPCIGGLELCSEEHLVRPCTLLLIFGVEETAAELIDPPVELEHERVLARRQFFRRRNCQQLGFAIEIDCCFGDSFAVNFRGTNRKIERIQNDLPGRLLDI